MKKKLLAALGAGLIAFTPFTVANAAPARDNESIYQVARLQSFTMSYFDGSKILALKKPFGDVSEDFFV